MRTHRTFRSVACLIAVSGLAHAANGQCPPSPPQSLSASQGVYCGSVFLDWTDVSGANNYTIYRNTSNNYGSSSWVGTAVFGNSQFTDVTAAAGTRYYYWVVATRNLCLPGSTTSNPSAVAQGWKKQGPAAPTWVSASEGGYCSGIMVWWSPGSAPLGGGVESYTIYRNTVNLYLTSSAVGTVGGGTTQFLDTTAEIGQTYYYWVRAENECGTAASAGASGFKGTSPPPVNETCATATPVFAGNSYLGSNVCAAPDGPSMCSFTPSGDVWYRFDATAAGTLTVETCGQLASFDTMLGIYEACQNLQNNLIACDDDACADFLSRVSISVVAGNDYYIRVAGYPYPNGQYGPVGNFRLTVQFSPSACFANCDGSTGAPLLTANDFQCFLNKYAAGNSYANCDGSTGVPVLTANDFQCFLNKYAAGCS